MMTNGALITTKIKEVIYCLNTYCPYWDFKKIDENYLISCLNDKSKFLGA